MSALRVLWTDDDPPERMAYESFVLEEEGFQVTWAPDVGTAARKLAGEHFDALILDQMLPNESLKAGDPIWNGCLLLRWLRGAAPPPAVSLDPSGVLSVLRPDPGNQDIPTVIVSAFHDQNVEDAMREASPRDRQLPMVPKPIDVDHLLRFLQGVTRRGGEAR